MGGSPLSAHQPNGVAVNGLGRKLNGHGFKTRYDQIEDPVRNRKMLDGVYLSRKNLLRGAEP